MKIFELEDVLGDLLEVSEDFALNWEEPIFVEEDLNEAELTEMYAKLVIKLGGSAMIKALKISLSRV